MSGEFAPHYRVAADRDLLLARERLEACRYASQWRRTCTPDFTIFSRAAWWRHAIRKHVTKPKMQQAIAVLRGWNGQVEKSMAAPLIMALVYQHLRLAAANSASPGKGQEYDYEIAPAVIQSIVENGGAGWFKDLDETLAHCLSDAYEDGRKFQGGNVARWQYGAYNELTIKHPVGGEIPLVGRYFNIGPVPMSGSSTTVKQTTRKMGPSMRFIADLSSWDGSLNNLTIGESGQILSSHYKDQWDAYYVGEKFSDAV